MIMINKALDLFSKSLEFISWIPIKVYNRFFQGNKKVVNVNLKKSRD